MASKTLEHTGQPVDEWLHAPKAFTDRVLIDPSEGVTAEHLAALEIGRAAVVASEVCLIRESCRVDVEPTKTVERRRSAHEVGFGAFVHRTKVNRKGRSIEQAVALKPFSRPEKALHELAGYLTLGELGIETFQPVGVFPAKDGNHFVSVTKKRNDLTSLDRALWVRGRMVLDEASAETARDNNETIEGIATLLGFIHSRGVFHPDGQIKNYAKTPKGVVGIIDTENLIVSEPGNQNALENAWHDIEKLVKSLIISTQYSEDVDVFGVGMFYGLPLGSVRKSIEELIIAPYLDSLATQSESADAIARTHITGLYEGSYERFFKDESWPDHFIQASHLR